MLDTHAWIWWAADRAKLSVAARKAIEDDPRRGVAAISLWEVSTLAANGKLLLDRETRDWLHDASSLPGIELLPIRPDVAVRSTRLGRTFQGDPADRLIVATAMSEGARLVTKDARIRDYPAVETIW